MAKKLFNFYLEDAIKELAMNKLENIMGKREKGAFASLIRVMINEFVCSNDENYLNKVIPKVEEEYVNTQLKNKRSTM